MRFHLQGLIRKLNITTNKKTFFEGRLRIRFLGKFLHSLELRSFPIFEKFLDLVQKMIPIIQRGRASLRHLASIFGKYLALIGTGALCQSQELFHPFSELLSNGEDLKTSWQQEVHLSNSLLEIFTEWIISATAYFFPSLEKKLPK